MWVARGDFKRPVTNTIKRRDITYIWCKGVVFFLLNIVFK